MEEQQRDHRVRPTFRPDVAPSAPLATAPPADPARAQKRARRTMQAALVCGALVLQPIALATAKPRATDVGARPDYEDQGAVFARAIEDARSRGTAAAGRPAPVVVEVPLATFEDVALSVPSAAATLVGFHESYSRAAPAMTPSMTPVADHNPRAKPAAGEHTGPDHPGGPPVHILPTRARQGAPTSAVDVAVQAGSTVVSPVTGTVRKVAPYALYGRHPDTRVEIEPAGRPDLRVVIIHVIDVYVAAGERVEGGETPLAGAATLLPFEGQIDRFAAAVTRRPQDPHPHVHVELLRVP